MSVASPKPSPETEDCSLFNEYVEYSPVSDVNSKVSRFLISANKSMLSTSDLHHQPLQKKSNTQLSRLNRWTVLGLYVQ